tara:strand:+ start:351 stop:695 length:345 start_codon:yes stop_codon:yes gene_type:complete
MRKLLNGLVFLVLLIAVLGVSAPAPDMVVVVYESSESIPEPYVTGALKTISSEGLQTRVLDKDVTTGEGEVPSQVQAAIKSATQLPSLVVLSGDTVISSQPLPSTYDGILEAVR